MKRILKNNIEIVKYLISCQGFKLSCLLLFVLGMYGGIILGIGTISFNHSIYVCFNFSIFNIFLYSIFFYNTYFICKAFNRDFIAYIIRLKDRREYLNRSILFVLVINVILIFIFLLFYFGFLLLINNNYSTSEISNNYIILFLIKYFVILISNLFIITLLINKVGFNSIIFLILYFAYIIINNGIVVDNYVMIGSMFLSILLYIIFNLKDNYKLSKYLFLSDINYLIKNRLLLFILILVFLLFCSFIYINDDYNYFMNILLGTNITKSSSSLDYVFYVLNISINIFIVYDLFIKDLRYQLDNIFLRVKSGNWIIKKLLLCLFVTLVIKLGIYLCLSIIHYFSLGINYNHLAKIFISDIMYIYLVELFGLLIYILLLICGRMQSIVFIISILILMIIPKNILSIYKFVNLAILLIFILFLLIVIIINRYKRKIIEESGGR